MRADGDCRCKNCLCKMKDCSSPIVCLNWCKKHYTAFKRHGSPSGPPRKRGRPPTTCLLKSCSAGRYRSREYCYTHYYNLKAYGNPARRMPVIDSCSEGGCERPPPYTKGRCQTHYAAYWRRNNPDRDRINNRRYSLLNAENNKQRTRQQRALKQEFSVSKATRTGMPWTKQEDAVVLANQHMDALELALVLSRSHASVENRRKRIAA